MSVILAIPHLFDAVVALAILDAPGAAFATESGDDFVTEAGDVLFAPGLGAAPQVFGWRELEKHPGPVAGTTGTTRRIVWVPGDDDSGDLGELGAAKQPGRNPRPLATLDELVTVYLEAVDLGSAAIAENERSQYQACRELFDAWVRWVHHAGAGTYAMVSGRWVTTQKVRRHGTAIRVVLSVQAMVPDRVLTTIGTDARAEWTLEVSGNTETGSTTDAP